MFPSPTGESHFLIGILYEHHEATWFPSPTGESHFLMKTYNVDADGALTVSVPYRGITFLNKFVAVCLIILL